MKLALKLAEKGRGRTSPNPMVGAVVVKDGNVIGRGFHEKIGTPHAEIMAINKATKSTKGATLYINLEPCNHQGRTPPCTDTIIKSGIKKVVVGVEDPNPVVSGRGIKKLKEAGIDVKLGVLEEESKKLNEAYIKYITTGKPFVILKVATSLDGKIATRNGESQWITGEVSRKTVHQLRNEVDAVLVGIGTVFMDNPRLSTRLNIPDSRDPLRIIVDSLLRIPSKANVFNNDSKEKTIIVTTQFAPADKIKLLEDKAKVIVIKSKDRRVNLKGLLKKLGQMGVTSLMVEGGSEINFSILSEGLVDKVIFFIAPKIIGGRGAKSPVGGEGVAKLKDAVQLTDISIKRFEDDIMVEGYVKNSKFKMKN